MLDRAAALEAFQVCQAVLKRELGIAPAANTLTLAERARSGEASQRAGLPVMAVQAKPAPRAAATSVFVGREREWTMLEEAWNENLIAYVSGEPGSGKSRVMLEFLGCSPLLIPLANYAASGITRSNRAKRVTARGRPARPCLELS